MGPTPERAAKGTILSPIDALAAAGCISRDQHRQALEFARFRRLLYGDGLPVGDHRRGGRPPSDAERQYIETKYGGGRRAIGEPKLLAIVDRVLFDGCGITDRELAWLRRALCRLVDAWESWPPFQDKDPV